MKDSSLNSSQRRRALAKLTDDAGLDVLVIGGGATGAGIALDAVTRGLRTGIVEMQDWGAGTSSRSSGLIHGGLRYLYQLDLHLVSEALAERSLLMERVAPHLVRAQPFLWPVKLPIIERLYSGAGIGLYDTIAYFRGGRVPVQRHYDKAGALGVFPDIRPNKLTGAIRFYDARVDDARLVVDLVRTAVGYGAHAASRTRVVDLLRQGQVVAGAVVEDLESGQRHEIRARHVINATGVWTEDIQQMATGGDHAPQPNTPQANAPQPHTTGGGRALSRQGDGAGLSVLASKGVHIVVPKERVRGRTGLFLRTKESVLFVIPWPDAWVIGTTDTPYGGDRLDPSPTPADIDYILDQANQILRSRLTRDDVLASYAGLRPLLQPLKGEVTRSAKVSREHAVAQVAPGLVSIAGGKLTTYRVMAEDAVDFAIGAERAAAQPSVTRRIPLVGAVGYEVARNQAAAFARRMGWDQATVEHLLGRYGSELPVLADMIADEPSLGRPLAGAPRFLRAEVAFAVQREGALHLGDVLDQRLRLGHRMADGGAAVIDEVGDLVAPLLGWDDDRLRAEKSAYL